jgi:hypothetical protein
MDLTLLLPGIVISILLVILLYKKLGFKPIKLKKPHVDVKKIDSFIQEAGLIGFFCLVFVGIRGYDWRIACIICGTAGVWFFFPRREGK